MARDQEQYRTALAELHLPGFAPRPTRGSWVVAIEGANGAGKSSLCLALHANHGVEMRLGTDPAWFGEAFKTRMIRDAQWFASAMFFLSGCFEQMRLLSSNQAGVVVMDRSLWSTLAVHAAHNLDHLAALLELLRPVAREVRAPDLTIVLDASFGTCQTRIARKTGAARDLDALTATQAFHGREQEFYRWLSRERPEVAFVRTDGLGPQEVARRTWSIVEKRKPC